MLGWSSCTLFVLLLCSILVFAASFTTHYYSIPIHVCVDPPPPFPMPRVVALLGSCRGIVLGRVGEMEGEGYTEFFVDNPLLFISESVERYVGMSCRLALTP